MDMVVVPRALRLSDRREDRRRSPRSKAGPARKEVDRARTPRPSCSAREPSRGRRGRGSRPPPPRASDADEPWTGPGRAAAARGARVAGSTIPSSWSSGVVLNAAVILQGPQAARARRMKAIEAAGKADGLRAQGHRLAEGLRASSASSSPWPRMVLYVADLDHLRRRAGHHQQRDGDGDAASGCARSAPCAPSAPSAASSWRCW